MSRFRPAMSAPRLPTNATSVPSTASHAAMFAPEPAAVHGYGGGSIASPGQRVERVGDGVCHEITDDNDARHVVLTSSRKHTVLASDVHVRWWAAGKNLTP